MVLPHHEGSDNSRWRKGTRSSKETIFCFSLGVNLILLLTILYLVTLMLTEMENVGSLKESKMVWHGGRPADDHAGTCWCGATDKYCMCTPNLAVDVVIVSGNSKEYLWLVRRKDTNQLATMGGFVEIDETAEFAVERELKEEMGVNLRDAPVLFGVYSDPRRDNRRRTVSVVYVIHLEDSDIPQAGDDAKEVKRILMDDIEKYEYFADHKSILLDYRSFLRSERQSRARELDFAPDIMRSTCHH